MLIEMTALRNFPLGEQSRTLIQAGSRYTIDEAQVPFHEDTGRGRRVAQAKPAKKGNGA